MASEPPNKSRRPRFTVTEALTLVEEVERRGPVILGRLDNRNTADKKNRAWEEVTAAVNEVSHVGRTSEELRRKFKDLRSHVKIKAAAEQRHIAGTGGGPASKTTYTDVELVILRMLSPAAFAGLPVSDSQSAKLRMSGPLEGPQPSTSSGVGVIQPSSAGVSVSTGASGFTVDDERIVEIIHVTDDTIQSFPDPDDTQPPAALSPPTQPPAALQPPVAPQPAGPQPAAALQSLAAPLPSPLSAAQQSRSRRHTRTPAGGRSELELLPQALDTQRDMQCSLDALVMTQKEQGEALQRGVQALQQIAASQQQALQQIAESHQQSVEMQRLLLESMQEFVAHAMRWFDANH